MAPSRPRALDDSRSETSSSVTNIKDKTALPPVTYAGVPKNKRNTTGQNGIPKATTNGGAGDRGAQDNTPKTDWNSLPASALAAYRSAYHLPTAPSYSHPHADILYRASKTAMRAPSQVQQRKRLIEARRQQQRINAPHLSTQPISKKKSKAADKNSETSKENDPPENATSENLNGGSSGSGDPGSPNLSSNDSGVPLPPVEQIERQNPQHLAAAVRKHFNAQQLNEAETISRFIYVARNSASRDIVSTEGSAGDGHGYFMGSHGREVRRGEGGEPGFRLRFAPG